ncbi:MAG: ATP-dependent zinc metalloprotease FtsH [Christensenellales bacterium]
MKNNRFRLWQGPLLYALLLIGILSIVSMISSTPQDKIDALSYSEALTLVKEDKVRNVMTSGTTVIIRYKNSAIPQAEFGMRYDAYATVDSVERFFADVNAIYAEKLGKDASLITTTDYAFSVEVKPPPETPWWVEWLPLLVSFLLFGGLWYFIISRQAGGPSGMMNFAKSRAQMSDPTKKKVTFADVAGADEEKEELMEIVEFLKDPKRFTEVGARIPKGVLLVGPPGTGKTLIARAVSGEAGVPFFSISGSDFVEMFVGVGASRVRDLFDQAKKNTPAIVFIDEIDAVGRQRGAGLGGGHDEREQTLNQLLVEMDGFDNNSGVIVMAATNRADILDPALLRPGRFDRRVTMNYPDIKGREEILKVHSRGKPLSAEVDLNIIARRTPFFTGADLENVMNEGALLAAREHGKEIRMDHIEEAITRVSIGPEKKSRRISEASKRLTACHEAGHAIVTYTLPECDTVREISIIPRGQAAGYTMSLPSEELTNMSSKRLKAEICSLLAGHCAEGIVFGDVSTGSQSDLKRATNIARSMVTEYGMSEKLGPIFLGGEHEVFLGRDFSQTRASFSEMINNDIDTEVRSLLDAAYDRAKKILTGSRAQLDELTNRLVEREKIEQAEFEELMRSFLNPPALATE